MNPIRYSLLLFMLGVSLLTFKSYAQFTITEDFRGSSVGSDIQMGGTAYLTSGVADPVNNGWLRLTEDSGNQSGYAYIDVPFPSSMGVFLEFEYKSWRTKSSGTHGADGFSVFLFDAATPTFRIGRHGGSLGYSFTRKRTTIFSPWQVDVPGLAGAYLGVGFDEFGNFARTGDGNKVGGTSSEQPNSITLRGPEVKNSNGTTNANDSYRYLTHKNVGNTTPIADGSVRSSRPGDGQFYRRVKVYIEPQANNQYKIRVEWRTTPNGPFVEQITYTTTDPIPANLKVGFSASTGGSVNYHEIRNLVVTTTGGVRVQKEVNKNSALPGDELEYTIRAYNETANPVSNLVLNDLFTDANNNPVDLQDDFEITSITFNQQGVNGYTATGFETSATLYPGSNGFDNPLSTTLSIPGLKEASFTIKGIVKNPMKGKKIKNSVELDTSQAGITDPDPTNNYASVITDILNPDVDLKIEKFVDKGGIVDPAGNTFTILVTNASSQEKPAGTEVTVTDLVPSGLTVKSWSASGWTRTGSGNNFTLKRSDKLDPQFQYPPIIIIVEAATGTLGPWENTANLAYTADTDASNNSSTARLAYKNYWKGTTNNDWDDPVNWSGNYVPDSGQDIEFATALNNSNNGPRSGTAERDLHTPANSNKVVNKLINASDKNLVIHAATSVKVNDVVSIADETNPNRIQIRAEANKPNGSFIMSCTRQSASAQPDVYATVQLYAKSQKYPSEQTWTDNIPGSPTEGDEFKVNYSWQFFGVPVESVRAEPTFYAAAVRQYFEDWNGDNSQYYQKWKNIHNEDHLQAFKGYEITQQAPTTYTIQGKLVYCDQTLTMTRKAPEVGLPGAANLHYGLGQNIFANSFTAAANVADITFPAEAEETVYLYNTGSFVDWGEADAVNSGAQSAGQYTAIPKNSANYDGKIPSMNGFLVKFLPNQTQYGWDDKTLTLKYSGNGVSNNTQPQTAPRNKQNLSWLEVVLEGNNAIDRLWLYSQPGTTAGFDNGWDGFKFFGTPHSFIFTETEAGPMQVDTDESIDGKTISFYANANSDYTLHIMRSQLQGYENLHLLDLVSRRVVAIDRDTVNYHFSAGSKGKVARRFLLVDSPSPELESDDSSLLSGKIYNRNRLTINNFTASSGRLMIYDTGGRLLMQDRINDPIADYHLPLQAGIYLLHMEAGGHRAVEKVIIQ